MKNTYKILYLIFTLFTFYFFVAELLFFKYSLNGVWTIRIFFFIWLSITIFWIIQNWKRKISKVLLIGIIITPIFFTFFAGILAMDFLYSIPNLNFYKSQKIGKYYVYERGGFLVGRFLTLYENKMLFKIKIASQVEHSETLHFEDAKTFQIVSENKDSIEIKYSKYNISNQIVFKK